MSFLYVTTFIVSLFILSSIGEATVPNSNTFKAINSGLAHAFLLEGDGQFTDAQLVPNQPFTKLSNYPFYVGFYTTDRWDVPNRKFTLAIRLQHRLVWIAEETYKQVTLSTTLAFGADGNLVLADGNGQVLWQTGTADKGVVDVQLLPNGNLVLLDSQGAFVWQSFYYPTDVLLNGQSLRVDGVNKLVSRTSPFDPTPGDYSLVMEHDTMTFYYKSNRSVSEPQIYSHMESLFDWIGNLTDMKFGSDQAYGTPIFWQSLGFTYVISPTRNFTWTLNIDEAQTRYNATYSFLQLGGDGNLRFYTYFDKVVESPSRVEWEISYTLFSRSGLGESECKLPERCGNLGVCEDNQCVACPKRQGLLGWSKDCVPPTLPACSPTGTSVANVTYYKVVGVDHFYSNYGGAPLNLANCRRKCTKDCTCKGFFYKALEPMCLVTNQLNTFTKVSNSTHLAYIKFAS